MRTGFDLTTSESEGPDYISAALTIIQPVFEQSVVLAAQYAKACGRDVMIDKDMEYAMKYCIMHTVGVHSGSFFQDDDEDDEDDEDDDDGLDIVDEEDCPDFERYSGDDPFMNKVNEAVDNWDDWKPQSPIEEFLKNALDNNG